MSYLWKSAKGRPLPPVMHRAGPTHDGPIRSGKERYATAPEKHSTEPQVYCEGRLIVVCDHKSRLIAVAVVKTEGRIVRRGTRGCDFKATDPKMLISMAGAP